MSSNISNTYFNNRCLNLYYSYPKQLQIFNSGMKHPLTEFSHTFEQDGSIVNIEQKLYQKPYNKQLTSQDVSLKRKHHIETNLCNPLDIFDNVSFVKFLDLNSESIVIELSKIKYIKLIDKDGNVIFKELHKKDFSKSFLKSSVSLDILDKNIIFINFVDFNNNIKSIRLNQIQFIKLYDKKINLMLTKYF